MTPNHPMTSLMVNSPPGDEHVYCVVGPAETSDGTGGRWVDAAGAPRRVAAAAWARGHWLVWLLDGLDGWLGLLLWFSWGFLKNRGTPQSSNINHL